MAWKRNLGLAASEQVGGGLNERGWRMAVIEEGKNELTDKKLEGRSGRV